MVTAHCPACGNDVTPGEFCPTCGARRCSAGNRFRRRAYAAAPRERVVRPWLVSSLFPRLPVRSRSTFRAGLAFLVIALAGFAALRWQAPMIATAAFGLPLLFALYLRETDVRRDLPVRDVVLATVLGLVLGAGWSRVVDPIVAEAYNTSASPHTDVATLLWCGVAIPVAGSLLQFVPTVVVRVVDRARRDSLDGYAVGGLGAMAFTAAATTTHLLPQLMMGLTVSAAEQTVPSLLAEAMVEGLAWPLVSLATGGIVGIALWFTPAASASRQRRAALVWAALVVLAVWIAMWLLDVAPKPMRVYLVLLLLVTASAVFACRVAIAGALLHEAPGDLGDAGRLMCAECGHVGAETAFCPSCGIATRAASGIPGRRVRSAPSEQPDGLATAVAVVRRAGSVLVQWTAGVGVAVGAAVAVAVLAEPARGPYVCPRLHQAAAWHSGGNEPPLYRRQRCVLRVLSRRRLRLPGQRRPDRTQRRRTEVHRR